MSDVHVLEQELSRSCNELNDKKADKELVLSALNAVSVYLHCVCVYTYASGFM